MSRTPNPDITTCLKEGWDLYQRDPWLLSGATLIVGLINFVAGWVPFATLLTYPVLLGGLYLMIMRLDAGERPGMSALFDALPQFLPLVLASLAISALVFIGLILLVLPGLYLALAYGFTNLIIVERKLDFWPAMEASRRMVTEHFWNYLLLMLLFLALCIIGSIPFGLGLLVAVPVCLAAQYRYYRHINAEPSAAEIY